MGPRSGSATAAGPKSLPCLRRQRWTVATRHVVARTPSDRSARTPTDTRRHRPVCRHAAVVTCGRDALMRGRVRTGHGLYCGAWLWWADVGQARKQARHQGLQHLPGTTHTHTHTHTQRERETPTCMHIQSTLSPRGGSRPRLKPDSLPLVFFDTSHMPIPVAAA
jgi:hypothetical protein